MSNWSWVFFLGFSGLFLLFFPDGRLPSPRWRWLVWLQCCAMVVSVPTGALSPETYIGFPGTTNPLGIERADRLLHALEWVSAFLFLAAILSVVALLLRYRRSRGEQRAQLKWMVAAGAAAALSLPVTAILAGAAEALGAGTTARLRRSGTPSSSPCGRPFPSPRASRS